MDHQNKQNKKQQREQETRLSAESVLASCARQKKLMLEDLRALQCAFWHRSRELWADSCVETKDTKRQHLAAFAAATTLAEQQHYHHEGQIQRKKAPSHAQKLLGELERVKQLESELSHLEEGSRLRKPTQHQQQQPRRMQHAPVGKLKRNV